MKRALILIFLAVIAVSSCETLEDNSPAMQATIDSTFFKAGDVLGKRYPNNNIRFQGVTQGEMLTIQTRKILQDTYILGPGEESFAQYQDVEGNIYTTDTPGGSGEIVITTRCLRCGWVTGTFQFVAINPGIDTITVSKGFMYMADFNQDNLIGEEPNADENSLTASVNGAAFNPTEIAVNTTQGVVTTEAEAASQAIIVQVPENALPGTYNIGDVGYAAGYRVDGGTVIATDGTITVVSNDTLARQMVINFSFTAGEYQVTNGSMTIFY